MKRYDFHDDGFDNCDMRLHPEGEFVRYVDVASLEAFAEAVRAKAVLEDAGTISSWELADAVQDELAKLDGKE